MLLRSEHNVAPLTTIMLNRPPTAFPNTQQIHLQQNSWVLLPKAKQTKSPQSSPTSRPLPFLIWTWVCQTGDRSTGPQCLLLQLTSFTAAVPPDPPSPVDTQSPPRSPEISFFYVRSDHAVFPLLTLRWFPVTFRINPTNFTMGLFSYLPDFPAHSGPGTQPLWGSSNRPSLPTPYKTRSPLPLLPPFIQFSWDDSSFETFAIWPHYLKNHLPLWSSNSAWFPVIAFITTRNISTNLSLGSSRAVPSSAAIHCPHVAMEQLKWDSS